MHGELVSTSLGGGAVTTPTSIENLGGGSESLGDMVSSMPPHHEEVREEVEANDPLLETTPPTVSGGTTPSLNVSSECLSVLFPFILSFGRYTESLLLEGLGGLMAKMAV